MSFVLKKQRWSIFFLPFLIIVIGFLPRISGVFHLLPDFPHIDEKLVVRTVLNLSLSDLNPHDFIEDNFALVKEFRPVVDKPIFSFIYTPLYHSRIKIYDATIVR